ncbi:MAG TPA: C25 family cysteine peptidase [Candidatus Deferrimicrobium sp.]|nr:C25 family cysteine peptidase [Candidatus Deferrimicrobium sp.]
MRGWLAAIALVIAVLPASAQGDVFPGQAGFEAGRTIISMPYGMVGLVFDTSACADCRNTLPIWRFLGNSKIDSVVSLVRGQGGPSHFKVEPLTDSTQLEGVRISSSALLHVLEKTKVIGLRRRLPGFNPKDTLKWDPIRLKWHREPDMSLSYEVVFHDTLAVDSVVRWLRLVPGLSWISGLTKPEPRRETEDSTGGPVIPKSRSEQGPCRYNTVPWLPNDPLFTNGSQWHLKEKNWGTGEGGITAACAWGLLKDYKRGDVIAAIIDEGIDSTHPDLDWKVSSCAHGISSHATKEAGLIGAITNNAVGIASVAPDAIVYGYGVASFWNDIILAVDDSCKAIVLPYDFRAPDSTTLRDMENALKHAYNANATVVVVTGNTDSTLEPFFSYPSVWDSLCISVGSHSFYGNRAITSNYTCDTCPQLVDVVAPGVGLTTTAPGGGYDYIYSGTCPAAAVVAGMAALAYGYDPHITPEVVEAKMQSTANNAGLLPGDSLEYGHGRVDAYEFINDVVNTSVASNRQSTADSIPCIIITNSNLTSTFQTLADRRTRRGTKTSIVTIETIATAFSGEDLQAQIRACIKDYYQNKHLKWVILGGDNSVVPFRYAFANLRGPGVEFICDYYFACLGGNWNYDGDTLYGEVADSVDLVPEVAVGRLPFATSADVTHYIEKLDDYEAAVYLNWQGKALFWGSYMFQSGDGKRFSQDLRDLFSSELSFTEHYDGPGGTASLQNYFNAMNSGQNIVVMHGLAGDPGFYELSREGTSVRLQEQDVDALANYGKPSILFVATCWNHQLDHDSSMALHYMKHPTGGAVAYIGSSYNDFVLKSHVCAREFFSQLFGSGPKELGALLNLAKQVPGLDVSWDGADRHTVMAYTLSGDPQLRPWTTETPTFIQQYHVDTVPPSVAVQIVDSVRYQNVKKLSGAVVCLMKDNEYYEVKYSNSEGEAVFNATFADEGVATIVASKHNFVYNESQIIVTSCCVWIRGNVDGDPYDEINVADQTYLVAFLFQGGPEPPCWKEGNVDGDANETITVADLSYLISYLYLYGPPPPACP